MLSVKQCLNPSDKPLEDGSGTSGSNKITPRYEVQLEDINEQLTSTVLVSAPDYIPLSDPSLQDSPSDLSTRHRVARCIAILDRPLVFTPVDAPEDTVAPEMEEFVEGAEDEPSGKPEAPDYGVDTALLVFPPGTLQNGSTTIVGHALITGEASMSAPRGKCESSTSCYMPRGSLMVELQSSSIFLCRCLKRRRRARRSSCDRIWMQH